MAICNWCNKEVSNKAGGPADTCSANSEIQFPDGTILQASTYHFDEEGGRCHDCNIKHGGFHHPGCDVERCPRCHGQLISCGCLDDDDDDETGIWDNNQMVCGKE